VFAVLVPVGVETRTLAFPATPRGVVAVILVALTTVTPLAATPPIVTVFAPVKLVPVIVTRVPPSVVPVVWLTLFTVGKDSGTNTTGATGIEGVGAT
jgi:hypothetical protein